MKCLAVAVVCAVALSGCGKSSNQKPSALAKIQAMADMKAKQDKEAQDKAAAEKAENEKAKQDAEKQKQASQPTTSQPAAQKTEPVKPAAKSDDKKADSKPASASASTSADAKKADAKKSAAKPNSAGAKQCQVESDGADIMKLNMQLKDAAKRYNVEKANFDKAAKSNVSQPLKDAREEAALEGAEKISAAAVASCEKVLKNHEKTAEQCASNKTLVRELNAARVTCDSYAQNNAAIRNSLEQLRRNSSK